MEGQAIVTGGAGFIGSHVVDRLLDSGVEVTAVDDLSTGRRENLRSALERGARLHEADIRDARAMRELLEAERPATVYHLAAQVSVTRSVKEVEFDADVNVRGTATVLEAARRAEVPRFVYISTGGALYGDAEHVPTPEDAPIHPLSPYGQSKWAGETYCLLYERLHGLSTVTLRLANIYGPRQDPFGEAGVVAIFSEHLQRGQAPTVFGDGNQTRDYVYVGDVAEAVLAAGASEVRGPFNIGRGRQTSVLDLLDALRALEPGADFTPEHAPARPGESQRSCLDPSRAERELQWRSRTELPDGLRVTYESFAA